MLDQIKDKALLFAASIVILIKVEFLELHGPYGQRSFVNINEISSLREPIKGDIVKHFPPTVKCIVVTTNGKFLSVVETCDTIHNMLDHNHAQQK